MGRNEYKGKRVTVTMPTEVFDALEKLARKELRSNSQAALLLIQEGLVERNLIPDIDPVMEEKGDSKGTAKNEGKRGTKP